MLHPGSHTDCSWTLKEVAGDGVWTGEKGASYLLRTQEVMRNWPTSGEEPGNGPSQSSSYSGRIMGVLLRSTLAVIELCPHSPRGDVQGRQAPWWSHFQVLTCSTHSC